MIDFGFWGGLISENIADLKRLKEAGAVGFKAFMCDSDIEEFRQVDDHTLLKGMQIVAELGSVLVLHSESDVITKQLAALYQSQGRKTARDYAASRPVLSEIETVNRAIAYAEITGCKLHIVHVSSGKVLERIKMKPNKEVLILRFTVETCPHYLCFTVDDIERIGAVAKCAPPLRERENVESLWEALKSGEIDMIGSDHSPSPPAMKVASDNGDFFSLWGGISGAQTTLNVMLEEGDWRRGIPLEVIVRVTATNPAKRFGLYPRKGTIAVGSDADLTLVDLQSSFVLKETDLLYRHQQSPYIGKSFRGIVTHTILRGRVVFQRGEIIDSNISGQIV
ncbi:allantoinase AllB [Parageobacillus thermoglucosidasius]|uniref:allantoinase AllB n=1 Tax=Parageobacillus thermoglucosidasius TaxID=1426 RepID=UPI00241C8AF4|nr:allantoinase AllB [Parageobacillus thermoglucosidasius]